MANNIIEVSTWRNSTQNDNTGAGYGIKFSATDFVTLQNWEQIILGDSEITLYRKNYVLNDGCYEIRNKLIGKYLIQNNLNKWQTSNPHKLKLENLGLNVYKLYI